jgi:hypothetical protein
MDPAAATAAAASTLTFGQVGRRRQEDEHRMEMSSEEYLRVNDIELYLMEVGGAWWILLATS